MYMYMYDLLSASYEPVIRLMWNKKKDQLHAKYVYERSSWIVDFDIDCFQNY